MIRTPLRTLLRQSVAISAFTTASFAALPSVALAAPNVATDILPVHSLVARVMEGLGEPSLIVSPGASPHNYSLKPSEAKILEQADLVFWIGEDLSPFLVRSITNLAPDATSVELLETEGTILLPFRTGSTFETHDHGDHDDHDHHEAHSEHADEAGHHDHDHHEEHSEHADKAGHDDHDHHEEHSEHAEEAGHHDHDHHEEHSEHADKASHDDHDDHADETADAHDHSAHSHDAHAWLDPENAKIWLGVIASELAEADPENAQTYLQNAEDAQIELDATISEIDAMLAPIRGQGFIVFHDAYNYFEDRFDIEAAGAISLGDGTSPGPARIREIQDILLETGATCVFREPQFASSLVAVVTDGTDVKEGTLDPIGVTLEPGPELYPNLLRGLAGSLTECL